jgi:actin-like ATPase involved in cell morphogenesis
MSYFLGIDLGTTYTAAAVCRDGKAEIVRLGGHTAAIPSVVLVRDDGEVLTGEAAERRAVTEPLGVAREFKRRFGDPTPVTVGGTTMSVEALTARLLAAVVAKVAEVEGGRPEGVTISHPANWGDFKKQLLLQAVGLAELPPVSLISEPEAAAIHYAAQERVAKGSVVAVYDLGGGTFDAAVLRRNEFGWQILGQPEGVEHLGGVDFDEAVFDHVVGTLGDDFDLLDPDDTAVLSAVARLRQECVAAKEALTADTDATVPVLLPATQTEVRLTRPELETMIRPSIAASIAALERALRSASVSPAEVTSVLLVGGSSRVPLVASMVGEALERPVALDAHPKHGVALGAAIVADERGGLAALTAAAQHASAVAAAMAGLAGIPGGTAPTSAAAPATGAAETASPADGSPTDGSATVVALAAATGANADSGSGNGADSGEVAAADLGPAVPGPRSGDEPGVVVSGAVAAFTAATIQPADERTTPRELPQYTPASSPYPGYATPSGAAYTRGTGGVRLTGPIAPVPARRRRRSRNTGPGILAAVSVMILMAAFTLYVYRGHDRPNVLHPQVTTTEVPNQVTTTSPPGRGDDRADQAPQRSSTTVPTTTTTVPTTSTTRSTSRTTVPPTTTAPTTVPPTTTPPTSESPTSTEVPPTSEPPTSLPGIPGV